MDKGYWLRKLAQGDLLSVKTAGKFPDKIQVPIDVQWVPQKVSIAPPSEQEGDLKGTVTGVLVMKIDKIKLIANVSMALVEKKKTFGGKAYYLAKAEDGSLLVMVSETTSVEEVHTEGEYRRLSRPGRDNELSILISALLGNQNPTKPFRKKVYAKARVLKRRVDSTRALVEIEDSIWMVDVLVSDVWGEYEVDIGTLNVLPKSLPVTKDLLLVILRKLLPDGSLEQKA